MDDSKSSSDTSVRLSDCWDKDDDGEADVGECRLDVGRIVVQDVLSTSEIELSSCSDKD
jgi:hypothetical protein